MPGVPLDIIAVNTGGAQGPGNTTTRQLCGFYFSNNASDNAILAVVPMVDGGASSPVIQVAVPDNADNVAAIADNQLLRSIARLTGFDGTNWDRVRVGPDNADAQAALATGLLACLSRLQGFNGTTFDRLRTASDGDSSATLATGLLAIGARNALFNGSTWHRARNGASIQNENQNSATFATLVQAAGEWAIQHTPAAATQATITRAAGGVGVRNICRSITASVLAVAAQGQIIVNLRDGTTGVGTILWSAQFALAAGVSDHIAIGDLNIVGSANTAMTLETAAAPAATNFASVALTGTAVAAS